MKKKKYAAGTTVAEAKTKGEIEKLLSDHGADQFFSGWESGMCVLGFRHEGRVIRFTLPMPTVDDPDIALTPTGRDRCPEARKDVVAQETKRRWRSLLLGIKAKLDAVETGIATFEQEFLAYTVLPDGSTVGDWAAAQLESAYSKGKMPRALLTAGAGR